MEQLKLNACRADLQPGDFFVFRQNGVVFGEGSYDGSSGNHDASFGFPFIPAWPVQVPVGTSASVSVPFTVQGGIRVDPNWSMNWPAFHLYRYDSTGTIAVEVEIDRQFGWEIVNCGGPAPSQSSFHSASPTVSALVSPTPSHSITPSISSSHMLPSVSSSPSPRPSPASQTRSSSSTRTSTKSSSATRTATRSISRSPTKSRPAAR